MRTVRRSRQLTSANVMIVADTVVPFMCGRAVHRFSNITHHEFYLIPATSAMSVLYMLMSSNVCLNFDGRYAVVSRVDAL